MTSTQNATDLLTEVTIHLGRRFWYGVPNAFGGRDYNNGAETIRFAVEDSGDVDSPVDAHEIVVYRLTTAGVLLASMRFSNVSASVVAAAVRAMIDEES